MKKFLACTLLTTTTLFPASLQLYTPASSGASSSCSILYQFKHTDDKESIYKKTKDGIKYWPEHQAQIVGMCSDTKYAEKYIASFVEHLKSEDKAPATITLEKESLRTVCPRLNEPIASYIKRLFSFTSSEGTPALTTREVLQDVYWDVDWALKRYLLASNIHFCMMNPNDTLPISGLTPLDHAAQQKDQELIFFLWERGARKANHPDTLDYVRKDVMMRSPLPQSVNFLKEVQECLGIDHDRSCRDAVNYEWATDLSREMVFAKIKVLFGAIESYNGSLYGSVCWISYGDHWKIKGDTPGAKALRDYVEKFEQSAKLKK